jgi:predicted RNase H-like HicB family nuclease
MNYRVVLYPSDEGFAVACPDLPGCWSQGATENEALANISDAIGDFLVGARDAGLTMDALNKVF